MKILFALAFLAVAWAVPDPIELPKAALPFVNNEEVQVKSIRLPAPVKPHIVETPEPIELSKAALPQFQTPDMRPLIIPAEVMRELTRSQPESAKTPVKVVDAPEVPNVEAVKVVDLTAPLNQVASEHVKIVEAPVYLPIPQEFLR